jgi:ribA/ribD-fused uncharacterized protein
MTLPANMVIDSFRGNFYFLSNMFPLLVPIWHNGIAYRTSEHLFVALKSLDPHVRQYIALQRDGFAAKREGKKIALRDNWRTIYVKVMKYVVRRKFSHDLLIQMLINTEPAVLIEGNKHHDNTWGTCMCENCKYKPGLNLLGQILMEERTELILIG